MLPWIGLLYTPLFEEGLYEAKKTYYWLYAFALAPMFSERKNPDLIIKMYLAGLSLNSAISILQIVGIAPLKKGLVIGLLGGSFAHIVYSLLLTTGILIASFYFLKSNMRKDRFLYGFLMLQYFFTLGFNRGRSGILALIVLSPLIIYNITGKKNVLQVLIASILALSLLFSFPVVRERLSQAKEDIMLYRKGNVKSSIGYRLYMWEIALSEIKKHPFSGLGTRGFQHVWEVRKKDPSLEYFDHPHNSFLFMFVSYGIVGLLAFCWLLFVLLKKGWKGRDTALGYSVFVFTSVFIIGSLTDTQVLPFVTATALPLFVGASEGVHV
jgi:O-antigen ligase